MKIGITGSSGLVGSAFGMAAVRSGHTIRKFVRSTPTSPEEVIWDPAASLLDKKNLEGLDAVVHLAGDSIAEGRWNAKKKAQIRESRVNGTSLLAGAIAQLSTPPGVLICASASGYYGNRGEELLSEDSPPGDAYLSRVCQEWEQAAAPAVAKGVRVVHLRFGIILSRKGGALAKMLLPFRMGAGGIIGNGKQYWSWLTLDDVVGMIEHAINTDGLNGPVNAVSPNPVTNSEFTETLARVLHRPAIFPVPPFAARLAFGEMADELLLSSFRMTPAKLISTAYPFRYPDLEGALRYLLSWKQ